MLPSVSGFQRRIGFGIIQIQMKAGSRMLGRRSVRSGEVLPEGHAQNRLPEGGAHRTTASMEGLATCLFVLSFVVVEVCGGMGGITKACTRRGVRCGPVVELALGYDVFDAGLFEGLLRLALFGRIWLMCLEPPCTSFSLARKPQMRYSGFPEGYYPADQKMNDGIMCSLLCALLCLAQWAAGNSLLLEQPGSGHMRFTCFWIF